MKKLLLLGASLLLSFASLGAQRPQLIQSARASQLQRNTNPSSTLRAAVEPGKGFSYTQKDLEINLKGGVGNWSENGLYVATCMKLPKVADGTIKGVSFVEDGVDNETTAFIGVFVRDEKEKYPGAPFNVPVIKVEKSFKVKLNHKALSTATLDTPFKMDPQKEYYVGYYTHSGPDNLFPVLCDRLQLDNYKICTYGLVALHDADKPFDASEGEELVFIDYHGRFGAPYIYVDVEAKSGELNRVLCVTSVKPEKNSYLDNAPAKVNIEVYNFGLAQAKQVVTKATDNGKDEKSVTTETIDAGKRAKLSVEIPADNKIGSHLVEAYVPSMEGGANLFADSKTVGYFKRINYDLAPLNKQLLVERFTTEECGYCPGADPRQEEFVKLMEKEGFTVNVVAHHSGFFEDFLTLKEDKDIANFLGVNSAPTVALNRYVLNEKGGFYAVVRKPDDLKKLVLSTYTDGSPMKIESITCTKKDGNKYSYEVKCKLFPGIDPNNTYVTVVAVEDGIKPKNQAGANKEYYHNNVARKYYTKALGDKLEGLAAGDYTYKIDNVVFDEKWDTDNVRLVVFFHGNDNTNIYNRSVYATSQIKAEKNTNSAQELGKEFEPRAFAQNGYILVEGAVEYYNVYNMAGQLVGNNPTQQYAPGVYVVRSVYGNQQFVSKVVVE